jgi:hypothetical protein
MSYLEILICGKAMAESTVLGDTLGYQGMNARGAKVA